MSIKFLRSDMARYSFRLFAGSVIALMFSASAVVPGTAAASNGDRAEEAKILAGFPDADSTGVRDSVRLQNHDGDMTITTAGAVVSGLRIKGVLRVEAHDVVIRDSEIISDSHNAIIIPDPYQATVEYCTIIGGVNGISGAGTFLYNDISNSHNGINLYGKSLIEHNYIHNLQGGPDAHFDGIENNGASDVIVRHNTIINDHSQTSGIMINNYFSSVRGIRIENNFISGGGYTIYSDARSNPKNTISEVSISNNYLQRGTWGYYAFMGNAPLLDRNHELGPARFPRGP